jgi:hypothetical protein
MGSVVLGEYFRKFISVSMRCFEENQILDHLRQAEDGPL